MWLLEDVCGSRCISVWGGSKPSDIEGVSEVSERWEHPESHKTSNPAMPSGQLEEQWRRSSLRDALCIRKQRDRFNTKDSWWSWTKAVQTHSSRDTMRPGQPDVCSKPTRCVLETQRKEKKTNLNIGECRWGGAEQRQEVKVDAKPLMTDGGRQEMCFLLWRKRCILVGDLKFT